jgi:myo-inositol-1(or 4)-monophosphatase
VDEAAELIRSRMEGRRDNVDTKSSPTDMVTEVDHASEALIAGRILEARPDDGMLGEEGTSTEGTSGYRWVFDPIDGTTNFLYGHPGYAVSVAVELEGEAVVGVVCDVAQREVFHAVRGEGATRNGEPIRASAAEDVSRALIATGFAFDARRRRQQGEAVARLLPGIRDIRRMGAAAVDLCSVACGRVDGFFERGLNPWDIAAGGLIASEAGAIVGGIDGGPPVPGSVLAAAPGVFEALRVLVLQAESG